MIVVLSDIHFTEAQSTRLGSRRFNRNIEPQIFRSYFAELNDFAVNNGIPSIDLVLAGDILEINRSALWLEGNQRPYVANQQVEPGSPVENAILRILDAIAVEKRVKTTLSMFHNLSKIFSVPVTVHYILGNHDRLVNATPATRARARELLGLGNSPEIFPHHVLLNDSNGLPFCLVRHGHEYNSDNFSIKTEHLPEIPIEFPESVYGAPSLGDIMSVEFGAGLPYFFSRYYGEEAIQKDKKLFALYKRLIEFDDVRPASALLSFLFSTPGVKKRKTWALVKPCFMKIIDSLKHNTAFKEHIRQSSVLSPLKKVFLMGALKLGVVKVAANYGVVKQIMKLVSRKIKLTSQAAWAQKESVIQSEDSSVRCVVSGHTHTPEVALIATHQGEERYYLNTGTWRNYIPATPDFRHFGHLQAITKVIIFRPSENPQQRKKSGWSFYFSSADTFGNHRFF
ncbi:MAG: metallophosphoesterase [Anaerolineae bacterium]|nr:metallophosphoesterase [Anaerolineae bacterium]